MIHPAVEFTAAAVRASLMETACTLKASTNKFACGGVDAPERDEAGYERARKQLTLLALKQVLRCEQQDTDKYGRIVARCYRDGDLELNAEQIQTRVAEEYCRFTRNYYGFCH